MNNSGLILEYIDSIAYDNGTSVVEDDTVVEFQNQEEEVRITTACEIPGIKRGWLGDITITKKYFKTMDYEEKIKINEVLSNMLCVRVNTSAGNDIQSKTEYVFLKY